MYRGIESPWGDVWQFVDGVNINDYQGWVCKDAGQYASNLFAHPYEQLSYVNHNANGYTTAMGYDSARPWTVLPVAVGDAATSILRYTTTRLSSILPSFGGYGTTVRLSGVVHVLGSRRRSLA